MVCKLCNLEMGTAASCLPVSYEILGISYQRIPYGEGRDSYDPVVAPRCSDCNVAWGGCHHPGCDREQCPCCQYQMLACICPPEEEAAA